MAPRPRLPLPQWRWSPLDIISSSFCFFLLLFLLLLFTRLGDPLAASGRRTLSLSRHRLPSIDRSKFISLVDGDGDDQIPEIEACSSDKVDDMPCEDPRRNSQLSREMNFYRERHCPAIGEAELCLVPPPEGYRIPISWPESLHKWQSEPGDKLYSSDKVDEMPCEDPRRIVS